MFLSNQIITSSQLLRHYRTVARYLQDFPGPILVSQKSGGFLVVINAEVFEGMIVRQMSADGVEIPTGSIKDFFPR